HDGLPGRHHRRALTAAGGHDGRCRGGLSVRKPDRLPPEELAPYLLEPPDPPAPLDLRAVFGNDRPVEAEGGFGKGLFLVTAAGAWGGGASTSCAGRRGWQSGSCATCGWSRRTPACSCATASPRTCCRRSTSTSPTRGGRSGTTSGACSRRSSPPSASGCCAS